MAVLSLVDAPLSSDSMKFPVFSLLTGNLRQRPSSLVTAPSSEESCSEPVPMREGSHGLHGVEYALRVSSPESRGVMPRNRPPFFNPSAAPIPKNKPAAAAVIPHARRTGVQLNASVLIYVLPMYFSCIDRVNSLTKCASNLGTSSI